MRLSIIIGFLLFLPSFSYSAPPEQDVFSSSLSGQSAGSYYALNVIQTLGSGHTGPTDSLTLYAESSGVDGDKILLARKPAETLFRFVGGFVDRTDVNWEMAARRELYEETKLSALGMEYVCSQAVEDWRYKGLDNGIMTTLFMTHAWDQMGRPEASDDIAEVKWFNIKDLYSVTAEQSQGDGHIPKKIYDFKIEDKIVPEHVELMKTFIKKMIENGK